jgi:hypothetical protein
VNVFLLTVSQLENKCVKTILKVVIGLGKNNVVFVAYLGDMQCDLRPGRGVENKHEL